MYVCVFYLFIIITMNIKSNPFFCLLTELLLQTLNRSFQVASVAKRGHSDESVPSWAKTSARRGDDIRLRQNFREHFPRVSSVKVNPHVRRINCPINFKTYLQTFSSTFWRFPCKIRPFLAWTSILRPTMQPSPRLARRSRRR